MPQINTFLPAVTPGGVDSPLELDSFGNLKVAGAITVAKNPSAVGASLNIDAAGALITTPEATDNVLNISVATTIKATAGKIIAISVVAPGSTIGKVNDCATTGAAGSANEVAVLDNTSGVYPFYSITCKTGITVTPGTGQTLAVFFI